MKPEEYYEMIRNMLEDAESLAHQQMVIVEVHDKLKRRRILPYERDVISQDHYGAAPFEPIEHSVAGVTFTTTMLHREGIQFKDINGADLLYEIENEKYVLVQYKKADSSGRITGDLVQLNRLLNNCPAKCYYKKRPRNYYPLRINGFCGCFYQLYNNYTKKYVHACEAKTIFGKRASVSYDDFSSGIRKATFEELFAKCRLGAMTSEKKSNWYISILKALGHAILYVLQSGRFNDTTQ